MQLHELPTPALIIDVEAFDERPMNEKLLERHLYDPQMPDVDLMIRTSGEYRTSNFLLWELAYAEMWFTDTLWPDFERTDMAKAVYDFQNRTRRYGGVTA